MTPPFDTFAARESDGGQAWLDSFNAMLTDLPPMDEAARRRSALIARLACVLDEMGEIAGSTDPAVDDALGWRNRADFEQRLEEWEAGRHPLQQPHG